MTLPNPGAQSAKSTLRRPQMLPSDHSIPDFSPISPSSPSLPSSAAKEQMMSREHALDFVTHSWDLATGGLKTLTAKRVIPVRPSLCSEHRISGAVPDILATSRSYTFALVIMACLVLMLVGGGIVLLVMLQP